MFYILSVIFFSLLVTHISRVRLDEISNCVGDLAVSLHVDLKTGPFCPII